MKKALKIIGIILLVFFVLVGAFLFWLTHRDQSLKETYRNDIQTGGEIEEAYLKKGPYETGYYEETTMQGFEKYAISYPKELETADKKYPVIVICNGTGWKGASLNKAQHQFYASYGFIVIATDETYSWNAFGAEMCIRHLERLNEYKAEEGQTNIFYQKVDFDRIGIVGHSQGGVAVFNAMTNTDHKDLYKTGVAISPTNQLVALALEWPYDVTGIEAPIMLISGAGGGDDAVITLEGLNAIYDQIPGDKLMTRRKDTSHGLTVTAEDGYVVAWFMWQLQDDQEAAKAFTGNDPEILKNEQYQDQQIDIVE